MNYANDIGRVETPLTSKAGTMLIFEETVGYNDEIL